jgi:carbonic anhydrase
MNPPDTGSTPRLPSVAEWLRHAGATYEIMRAHYGHLQGKALANAAAEENVLVQLEHLRTLPAVAARAAAGKIRLHGWMYKIETGEIFHYDAGVGQFVKFGEHPDQAVGVLAGSNLRLR